MPNRDEVAPVSHQTVRLSRGKHSSPREGACVMELASMLSGEQFSDRPASVCPVIGGFLRSYNDAIDDEHRQDLYEYAGRVVGTRGGDELERARQERCLAWAHEMLERAPSRRMLRWLGLRRAAVERRRIGSEAAGTLAARSIRRHTELTHTMALALVDELIAMRAAEPRADRTRLDPLERPAELAGQS
jgi:hypothetical protein